MATAALILAGQAPSVSATTSPVAVWKMDEPSGRTMLDSSGHGIDGTIGSAVKTGIVYNGATGYRWPWVKPNEPPAKPERLVTVDDSRLNPGSGDYSITVRYRTTHSAGNMIQKGQSGTPGGYFKWQNVKGKVTCLFRGYAEDGTMLQKAVNTGDTPLNDGAWHTLTCKRTADKVTMTIDGSKVRKAWGPTGKIWNKAPLTLAGKYKCDQDKITCDYFSGDMDYVRIEAGTGTTADTTAPVVTSRKPAPDATGVLRGSNVTATFDEAVTGVSASTMTLTKVSNGALMSSVVTYNSTSRTAKLNPDNYLAPNTKYLVTLTSGIADTAGNKLARTSWSFTTGG